MPQPKIDKMREEGRQKRGKELEEDWEGQTLVLLIPHWHHTQWPSQTSAASNIWEGWQKLATLDLRSVGD